MKLFVYALLTLFLFGVAVGSYASDNDVGGKIKTEIVSESNDQQPTSDLLPDIVFCQRTEVESGFATIRQGRSVELIEIRCYQHNAYTNNYQKPYTSPPDIFKTAIIQL